MFLSNYKLYNHKKVNNNLIAFDNIIRVLQNKSTQKNKTLKPYSTKKNVATKGKKATYNGAVGFSTNQFSVGKHKVKFMPASIKYKGSAISSIKIKKSATKTAKYFRTV